MFLKNRVLPLRVRGTGHYRVIQVEGIFLALLVAGKDTDYPLLLREVTVCNQAEAGGGDIGKRNVEGELQIRRRAAQIKTLQRIIKLYPGNVIFLQKPLIDRHPEVGAFQVLQRPRREAYQGHWQCAGPA